MFHGPCGLTVCLAILTHSACFAVAGVVRRASGAEARSGCVRLVADLRESDVLLVRVQPLKRALVKSDDNSVVFHRNEAARKISTTAVESQQRVTTLFGSHGSEGMLLQNSWPNLTSGIDVAATVATLISTKQTLLGMFVDECAYYDALVPILQATQGTNIRVFGSLRCHNNNVYCARVWGTNASTTSGMSMNWTRVATQLAAISVTYPHFIGFSIDDFYSMMQSPRDKPSPKSAALSMTSLVDAHKAMKAVAPEFLFMPVVYPEFLGVIAGSSGYTLGSFIGQSFGADTMAAVSFTPPMVAVAGAATASYPVHWASVGFWVQSQFPYFGGRSWRQRHSGVYDPIWAGVMFLRARRTAPDGANTTLVDMDLFELATCSPAANVSWTVQHCGMSVLTGYVNTIVPGLGNQPLGQLHIELYTRGASRKLNVEQSKIVTISGVTLMVGGQGLALGSPSFSTAGKEIVQAHDNAAWSTARASDGLLFCFAQNAGAVYTESSFHALLARAQALTQGVGQKLWTLNYAWMSLGQDVGHEFSENEPAFLHKMMKWEAEAGVDAVIAYNIRIEMGRLAEQSGIFTNRHPSPAVLAAAASEGGWGGAVAGFWPEHVPTYGGFFQSWTSRHSLTGNLSFGINREWHAVGPVTNESAAPFFFSAIIRMQGGGLLYNASTNVMPCTSSPLDTAPKVCPGMDLHKAANLGMACTVRCVASRGKSRRMFPETIDLVIPPPPSTATQLTDRAARPTAVARVANSLVLEFAMGGVGSWETQLIFAIEGSSSEDYWHYDAGVRDSQLVELYDTAVSSFAELQRPDPAPPTPPPPPPPPSFAKPQLTNLGSLDVGTIVEQTPVVVDGALWRFEAVHYGYHGTLTPESNYQRFVNMKTGAVSPLFGAGYALGSAFVDVDSSTVFAYGTFCNAKDNCGAPGSNLEVRVWWSTDKMQTWQSSIALNATGKPYTLWNTSGESLTRTLLDLFANALIMCS
eukprot:SAG11_NODE_181_length_13239_cov_10.587139_4_plen_977_part_00